MLEAPETEAPQPTKAPDLMAALEESIAAVKGGDSSKAKGRAKAGRAKAKKAKAPKAAPKKSSGRKKAKASK